MKKEAIQDRRKYVCVLAVGTRHLMYLFYFKCDSLLPGSFRLARADWLRQEYRFCINQWVTLWKERFDPPPYICVRIYFLGLHSSLSFLITRPGGKRSSGRGEIKAGVLRVWYLFDFITPKCFVILYCVVLFYHFIKVDDLFDLYPGALIPSCII